MLYEIKGKCQMLSGYKIIISDTHSREFVTNAVKTLSFKNMRGLSKLH